MADRCTLTQASLISRIPERTLWRWREENLLTVSSDWEFASDQHAAALLQRKRNALRMWPHARFDSEDLTRLLLLSHLGTAGWDRPRLLEALGHPWAVRIDPGRAPQWLVIFPDQKGRLDRAAADSFAEVTAMLQRCPIGYVANIGAFRGAAQAALAELKIHAAPKKRRVA